MEAISILAPDDVEAVHDRAMTIIEEIGTDVRHEEALALLRASGQDVDGERVRWDREFVMVPLREVWPNVVIPDARGGA